jgi:CheY-like chemotaxis protein
LAALGHEVCGAVRTGSELANLLAGTIPDLITIDLDLGGQQDGIGIATVIQTAGAVPIVFVTNPMDEDVEFEGSRSV